MDATVAQNSSILELTVEIVASHVANNSVATGDLPIMIQEVHQALARLSANGSAAAEEPAAPLEPAVPIKKSITPDYIICLEDGRKLKMLKRHLKSAYNLSPEQYREKWGLAKDYPMVAPNYAKKRQELAKKIGLGRK
ncbi:MucR family transcriptional regulator [Futiania mangrovi]|uniref:MucR family transcriptional regulator n=1 Tax=Futiania mangrovi TaxID=2959716 RepID=A0A9J6PF14_9PROT|nr:MucR family transcriptional regulator [Futiania mangrovii]MCP1336416.1 MucR family transcriptional regulator [Futiania mangrovii]